MTTRLAAHSTRPRRLALAALASAFVLAAAPTCRAGEPLLRWDRVVLTDGRVLTGSVAEDGEDLLVRLPLGHVRVRSKEVAALELTDDGLDELARARAEGLPQGTVEQRLRYAALCAALGDEDEARSVYLAVVELDPDQPTARTALGYVLHAGEWMTEDERQRALGFVRHRGRWITPAEREALLEAEAAERERAAQLAAAEREWAEAERQRAEAERERAAAELAAAERLAEAARQAAAEAAQAEAARQAALARAQTQRPRRRLILGFTPYRKVVGRTTYYPLANSGSRRRRHRHRGWR